MLARIAAALLWAARRKRCPKGSYGEILFQLQRLMRVDSGRALHEQELRGDGAGQESAFSRRELRARW